ncbi:hypothetical protein GJAV_G00063410 [Gymnothorax javanicus]|nr:hypothetical protein GJAV_G00063410 [Gymnothorax javanicus]
MEPGGVLDEEAVISPIVTTPPISRQGRAEELRSISSSPGSGTQISSSTSAISLGEAIAHRAKQAVDSWGKLPKEEDLSPLTEASVSRLGETSSWPVEVFSEHDPIQESAVTVAEEPAVPHHEGRPCSFQLEFQDSHLSPALPLLPDKSGKLHSLTEDTLFHQTDLEFVTLRGSPDISAATERFPVAHQISTNSQICSFELSRCPTADQTSLPLNTSGLTVATVEEASSCSLSQHTLSPFSEDGEQDVGHIQVTFEELQMEREPCYGMADQPMRSTGGKDKPLPERVPQEEPKTSMPKVSSCFQSEDISVPARSELPKRDVHLLRSGSVVSTASESSVKKESSPRGFISHEVVKPGPAPSSTVEEITEKKRAQQEEVVVTKLDDSRDALEQESSAERRECPLGVASCSSPTLVNTSRGTATIDTSGRSEVSNITTRASHAVRDADSDALREELCTEIERARQCKAMLKAEDSESHLKTASSQSVTPNTCSFGMQSGKGSVIKAFADTDKTGGQFSSGFSFERGHTERELLSSSNPVTVDGSFLGSFSQPVSQSTPGVFSGPPRASVQPPNGKLSPIESNNEASHSTSRAFQSSSSKLTLAPTFAIAVKPGSGIQCLRDSSLKSTGKIQSLPSLNFMEKVGAWNMNQTSGKTYFDNLALRGFSGVSPKKKAFDAVSGSLNRMLSQEGSEKRLVATSASNLRSHSPRRSLAASFSGAVSRGTQSEGGSFTESPQHSARNHLCADTGELQRSEQPSNALACPESLTGPPQREPRQNEQSECQHIDRMEPAGQQEMATDDDGSDAGRGEIELPNAAPPTTRLGLDRFSDVSSTKDLSNTLTCSQESYHFERRLATSMGPVSSVASLEVDNYVPDWTPYAASPAKNAELNIEERIPMYLLNLGIDQSPSTILTPFIPRGPIREPEFSPTDLCTLKGSIGTPTKSTQPSEDGTPAKVEFSRCSLLSVGSNASLPLSVDSLQPAVSRPKQGDGLLDKCCLKTALNPLGPLLPGSSQPPAAGTVHSDSNISDDPTALQIQELSDQFQSGKVFESSGSLSSAEAAQQQTGDSLVENKASGVISKDGTSQDADSFVGSKTLQEIRKLLGKAESIVSGKSSISSSPASLRGSDDSLLCLKRKLEGFEDSFTSSTGNQEKSSSLLWGKSSSESALASDGIKEASSSKLCRSPPAYGQNLAHGHDTVRRSKDSISNQAAECFPTKSVRRSEPEGCSASAPDRAAPVFISVIQVNPPTPSGAEQLGPVQEVMSPTESTVSEPAGNIQASSAQEAERAIESDSSSADSLARRVAALLRNESPATMASSNGSTTDEEGRKARELIKLKITGQQCELLQLNVGDRQRIEEIKRDLLQNTKHLTKSQLSTDTDSSTFSCAPYGQPLSHGGQFSALKTAEHQLSHQLQRLGHKAFDSSAQLHSPVRQDLEARDRDLTKRTSPPPITSITITSCRRTPSPAPPPNPTPSLLNLIDYVTGGVSLQTTGGHRSEGHKSVLQPKADSKVQVSLAAESAGEMVNVTNAPSAPSGHNPPARLDTSLSKESTSISEVMVQSKSEAAELPNFTSGGFEMSSTTVEGSRSNGGRTRSPFYLDPTSYRQVSRSDPNISSSSSLEPSAAPLHNSTFASGSCSIVSPTKKVLSHVHLTLSPHEPNGRSEGSAMGRPVQLDRPPGGRGGGIDRRAGLSPDFSTRLTSLNPPGLAVPGPLLSDGHSPMNRSSYFSAPRVSSLANSRQEPLSPPLLVEGSSQKVPSQPIRREVRETADASVQITTCSPQEVSSRPKPVANFTPHPRGPDSSKPSSIRTPATPILLPYKPQGSSELFYIPKSEAPLSDTTMESTHPGSDDAVPPKFSPEVLGSRDREQGEMVSTRHTEGIYSKRLSGYEANQGPGDLRMNSVDSVKDNEVQLSHRPYPAVRMGDSGDLSRGSYAWPNERTVETSRGDQEEEFAPLREEETCSTEDLLPYSCSVPEPRPLGGSEVKEPVRHWRDLTTRGVSSRSSGSNLNELWQRFNERRSQREASLPKDGETSLLERLERLSRLINSNRDSITVGGRDADVPRERREERKRRKEEKRREKEEEVEQDGGRREAGRGRRSGEREQPVQLAWVDQEVESQSSSTSTEVSFGRHHCPAEKDGETDTGDTASTLSTIDTVRLIRAFGPGRVQAYPGLNRLYTAIGRQKQSTEQRRGKKSAGPKPLATAPTETNSTDDSSMSTVGPGEYGSSDSDLRQRPADILMAKKAVKLVSKGVQAGDLEIVVNGTRKHTRDVGTIFPSPVPPREAGHREASGEGRAEERKDPKTQDLMNEKKSKKVSKQGYPQGMSWFVPADSLKANSKENQPEPGTLSGMGPVWFEPYTKTKPWREPLRERQLQEEPVSFKRRGQGQPISSIDADSGNKVPPALTRITLQEALEMRRPDFVSRSRERMKRLELLVEERRLQSIFEQEREQLFNQPTDGVRLSQPADFLAQSKRAVPRKEMFRRSKQIYSQLPEVQKRMEEERRKAEYSSYRLKAQLYKKKITNRVLGRRTPWQ